MLVRHFRGVLPTKPTKSRSDSLSFPLPLSTRRRTSESCQTNPPQIGRESEQRRFEMGTTIAFKSRAQESNAENEVESDSEEDLLKTLRAARVYEF